MNIREIVVRLLDDYENSGKYVNLSLNSHLLDGLDTADRGRVTNLLYTSVEHKITLDYAVTTWGARSRDAIDSHTLNVLRVGLCGLFYQDRIPAFASVNETVKLARHPGERAFINALLRRAAAEKEAGNFLPLPDRKKNPARYLSVAYSFPLPTVRLFISLYGEDGAERLLARFNEKPSLTVTVNTEKTDREGYLKKLNREGIAAERTKFSPNGIRIPDSQNPKALPGFGDGEFFVQDEASQIHGMILAPAPGMRVIDVCAAPGGKSFAAALSMKNKGEVISFDLHENKLSLIENGARRLGLSVVRTEARDALEPDETLFGTADRVVCDVPCSGLGVLGKKPDLRYKEETALDTLPELALGILTASANYLKADGVLLYSTCTLNPKENRAVVDAFLAEHPEFTLVPFAVGQKNCPDGDLTLLPHEDGTDGFYIAKLQRRNQL
ncbi:MAG: 16S rRNA (cytosine(967)-C(5))-methyltransferase RsmB [Clostridia bacterium]|nr:16S rRNA (cytosine(967)-C(5))-methyltransferase RsmB [Clostridia bacterium]